MLRIVPIEEWDNETLVKLTLQQQTLVDQNCDCEYAKQAREEALDRNVKELLRRLNKKI